jgi:TPR repeat protein
VRDLLERLTPTTRQPAQDGALGSYDSGSPRDVMEPWNGSSPLADAEAQFQMGRRYARGEGAVLSLPDAISWFQKAAESGHIEAQFQLGLIYFHGGAGYWLLSNGPQSHEVTLKSVESLFSKGMVVERNDQLALRWLLAAAVSGKVEAQATIGDAYRQGRGIEQNFDEARQWYLTAAQHGSASAEFGLGDLYFQGLGVDVDMLSAADWYRRAAEKGDTRGQVAIACLYSAGQAEPKNDHDVSHFERALEQGEPRDLVQVALMLLSGEGLPKDIGKAEACLGSAANQGYLPAIIHLAELHTLGDGSQPNLHKAAEWYLKAAELGDVQCQFIVGQLFSLGAGVPVNSREAAKWFMRAAENGHAAAATHLGKSYTADVGVPTDAGLAADLLTEAVASGDQDARTILALLHQGINAVGPPARQSEADAAHAEAPASPVLDSESDHLKLNKIEISKSAIDGASAKAVDPIGPPKTDHVSSPSQIGKEIITPEAAMMRPTPQLPIEQPLTAKAEGRDQRTKAPLTKAAVPVRPMPVAEPPKAEQRLAPTQIGTPEATTTRPAPPSPIEQLPPAEAKGRGQLAKNPWTKAELPARPMPVAAKSNDDQSLLPSTIGREASEQETATAQTAPSSPMNLSLWAKAAGQHQLADNDRIVARRLAEVADALQSEIRRASTKSSLLENGERAVTPISAIDMSEPVQSVDEPKPAEIESMNAPLPILERARVPSPTSASIATTTLGTAPPANAPKQAVDQQKPDDIVEQTSPARARPESIFPPTLATAPQPRVVGLGVARTEFGVNPIRTESSDEVAPSKPSKIYSPRGWAKRTYPSLWTTIRYKLTDGLHSSALSSIPAKLESAKRTKPTESVIEAQPEKSVTLHNPPFPIETPNDSFSRVVVEIIEEAPDKRMARPNSPCAMEDESFSREVSKAPVTEQPPVKSASRPSSPSPIERPNDSFSRVASKLGVIEQAPVKRVTPPNSPSPIEMPRESLTRAVPEVTVVEQAALKIVARPRTPSPIEKPIEPSFLIASKVTAAEQAPVKSVARPNSPSLPESPRESLSGCVSKTTAIELPPAKGVAAPSSPSSMEKPGVSLIRIASKVIEEAPEKTSVARPISLVASRSAVIQPKSWNVSEQPPVKTAVHPSSLSPTESFSRLVAKTPIIERTPMNGVSLPNSSSVIEKGAPLPRVASEVTGQAPESRAAPPVSPSPIEKSSASASSVASEEDVTKPGNAFEQPAADNVVRPNSLSPIEKPISKDLLDKTLMDLVMELDRQHARPKT